MKFEAMSGSIDSVDLENWHYFLVKCQSKLKNKVPVSDTALNDSHIIFYLPWCKKMTNALSFGVYLF